MIYKRGKVWYIKIRRNGVDYRYSTGSDNKSYAKDKEAELRGKLAQDQFDKEQLERTILFNDVWEKYMREEVKYKSHTSYARAGQVAKNLLPVFGHKTLAQVTPAVLSSYKAKRLEDGVSLSTTAKELQYVRRVFSLCKRDWQLVRQSPFEFFRVPNVNNHRVRFLEEGQMKKLLLQCPGWLRSMVVLASSTGMRRGNILGLTWSQVDLEKRLIHLDRTKNGYRLTLPLTDTPLRALEEIRKGKVVHLTCPYVFHRDGTPYSPWMVTMAFRRACKRAGIADFRFHDLRHDFASRLVQKGNELYVVQHLLGHRDGRMTQRYAHLRIDDLRDAVETLEQGAQKGAQSA
jgi:integrase